MKFCMGNISVKCKSCHTVAVLENDALHKMAEFRCPRCNTRMSDYERCRIIMHFNYLAFEKIHRIKGDTENLFEYSIDLNPHYEVKEDLPTK